MVINSFYFYTLGRLLTWDKKCVEYCHEGTFYHYKTKRCEKCDEICIACHTSKESCTVCSNGKYLFAGVACRKECAPNYYARIGSNDLRLIPDPYLSSLTEKNGTRGLVEIFMNNQWLPVCGANFHIQDAAIVCHQLGYGDPVDIFSRGRRLELGYMEELPQFNCTGTEKTVSECSTGWYMLKLVMKPARLFCAPLDFLLVYDFHSSFVHIYPSEFILQRVKCHQIYI